MNDKTMIGCEECEGRGFVHCTSETTDAPGPEWEAVQACDECCAVDGVVDDDAAAQRAAAFYGTEARWVNGSGWDPGEWWVRRWELDAHGAWVPATFQATGRPT